MEAEDLPNTGAVAAGAVRRRAKVHVSPGVIAAAITLLGGLLRLYHYNALSLWFDEGVSVYLSRLPWATIFTNIDAYDTHPPLRPALVKLVNLLLPEVVAGRLLSVVLGTLTIPVLYALTRRALDTRAALLASALLAVSPVHIWYSQEERPYAGVAFLVSLSYLALIAFYQSHRRWWTVTYGLATLAALYYDYSALFALAPQVGMFIYMTKDRRRSIWALWAAAGAAGLLFLPWATKMVVTVNGMTTERAPALGASPQQIGQTLLSLVGAAGYDRYFLGTLPTPWDRWPAWDGLMALGLVLTMLISVVALVQRGWLAGLVGVALSIGTVLVGVIVSLYRPGFAERTVISAVLGGAVLFGAAPWIRGPRVLRLAGVLGVVFIFLLSGLSLAAIYRGSDKDHWRDLAADTARLARFGWPIVTYHVAIPVLLDLYAPYLGDSGHLNVGQGGDLPAVAQAGAPNNEAVILDDIELPGIEHVRDQLVQQGYMRLFHNSYSEHSLNPIYMDIYARSDAPLLVDLPINGTFAGEAASATGWQLPDQGISLQDSAPNGRILTLTNAVPSESRALLVVPAQPHGVYRLDFDAAANLTAGRVRSFLICAQADGTWPLIAPDDGGATIPSDTAWHPVSISGMCPADTATVLLDLRNAGDGTVSFRNVALRQLQPSP